MKNIFKIFVVVFLISMCFQLLTVVHADTSFSVDAKSAIAVEANSGKILYSQNSKDSSQKISSLTKLITAYMVYKNIAEGKLKMTDQVPISTYAYALTQGPVANVPLAEGESFSVQDLLNATLIYSSNSTCIALAEKIGGTEPKFVDQMKQQLKQWGITDENLVNSTGLANSDLPETNWYPGTTQDSENTMSADDLAIVAVHFIKDFPDVLKVTSQYESIFDANGSSNTAIYSTNSMLSEGSNPYLGLDGLKTSTTGFIATADQNNLRLVTVILSPSEDNSTNAIFTDTKSLLNEMFNTWNYYEITPAGIAIKNAEKVKIIDGKEEYADVVPTNEVSILSDTADNKYTLKINIDKNGIQAPLKKGQAIASITIQSNNKLGYLNGFSGHNIALVTTSAVYQANPIAVGWNHFIKFINENF
ncbi:serine hydrolase [Lactovum miscens]|uniref:serine-type D-Ala-D-Ala carboxypeptidase n=1 Tax=Lactovum miscens TaxID=190387 RepID=A0A841CBU3_9LACT|nr:serine hydrolase [Lactovum miscens]MBB5888640.1 D-alanyl-D-alanine carboxypeptidase (penicillin-binding protein 5/6) [Lactovum miscens]